MKEVKIKLVLFFYLVEHRFDCRNSEEKQKNDNYCAAENSK